MKYLLLVLLALFSACDNGPASTAKSSDGPPSSPPEPGGVQADLMKYEAAKFDSLKKVSKDSAASKQKMMDNEETTSKDPLIGTWRWNYTNCCGRRPRITKDSTADKTTIKFVDEQTLNYYSGGKLTASKVYRTGKMADKKTIRIEGNPYSAVIQITADTLMIGYGYMDLQNEFYIRER